MNKSIKIKTFPLVDYNILLKVIAKYIEINQINRNKTEAEKDMFDLTDTVYSLQCYKQPVNIGIENHWKAFWVRVKESRTQYSFEIWYSN